VPTRTTKRTKAVPPGQLDPSKLEAVAAGFTGIDGLDEKTTATVHALGVDNAVTALEINYRKLVEQRGRVARDEDLSDEGRSKRVRQLADGYFSNILTVIDGPVKRVASRLRSVGRDGGLAGSPVTGAELVDRYAGGRTSGMDDAIGQVRLGVLQSTRDELLRLASNGGGEELRTILTNAASEGDLLTWSALDLAPSWIRKRILDVALVDAERDQELHRKLRATLDPDRAAELSAVEAASELLLANARTAVGVLTTIGHQLSADQQRAFEATLQPLTAIREDAAVA
jgi:hypothetical protein